MNRNQNDDSEWMKQHKSNLKYIMLSQDKNMLMKMGECHFYTAVFSQYLGRFIAYYNNQNC